MAKDKQELYSVVFNYMDKEGNLCDEKLGILNPKEIKDRLHIPKTYYNFLEPEEETDISVNVAMDYVVMKRIQ